MRIAVIAAIVLVFSPAAAQVPSSQSKVERKSFEVREGVYRIDAAHTQVLFTVNHLGFSEYTGQFTQPSGTLTLALRDQSKTRVEVSFPITKVSTTDPALDAHLQKPEFFDAAKYPVGKFVSTKVSWSKTGAATIIGDLTLKGVTKPVTLNARLIGVGPMPMGPPKLNIGFAATTTIKRSDFGIDYGVPMVSDRVDLTINAAFAAD